LKVINLIFVAALTGNLKQKSAFSLLPSQYWFSNNTRNASQSHKLLIIGRTDVLTNSQKLSKLIEDMKK
jgi:hypothetical protein